MSGVYKTKWTVPKYCTSVGKGVSHGVQGKNCDTF